MAVISYNEREQEKFEVLLRKIWENLTKKSHFSQLKRQERNVGYADLLFLRVVFLIKERTSFNFSS